MAQSGVGVDDDVVKAYNDIKLNHKFAYVQFKITDDLKTITVDKIEEDKGKTYEEFVQQLPPDDCRYAVYDYHFSLGSAAGERDKLVFILWCPDTAKVKKKMLYASSKDALKRKLVGIGSAVQATELSELAREDLEEKLKGSSHT